MAGSPQDIVDEAIDGGRQVVASIARQSETLSFSAQLLKREDEGFVFQADSLPEQVSSDAIKPGVRATFCFGVAGVSVQFQADLVSVETKADGVIGRCAAPGDIVLTQRRENFRAPVTVYCPVQFTVWKIPPHWVLRDRPKPSAQLRVELIDLSLGGMCLQILPHRLGPDQVAVHDRLRLEITFKEEQAVFDSEIVYRSQRGPDGSVRVGVALKKRDNSIDGRRAGQLINHAIAALQRNNIKYGTAAISA